MKKLVLLLFIPLFSFSSFGQLDSSSNSLKSIFDRDINKYTLAEYQGNWDEFFKLQDKRFLEINSKEEQIQSSESMRNFMIINFPNRVKVKRLSKEFKFEEYVYYQVFFEGDLQIKVVDKSIDINEIEETVKFLFLSKSDSYKYDKISQSFSFSAYKDSMVASKKIGNNNWEYIKLSTIPEYNTIFEKFLPAEFLKNWKYE